MATCALRVTSGSAAGQSIDVDREVVLGRDGADLTIDDSEMSRRHAAVRPVQDGIEIEDLGSTNGTFVNGRRIRGPERLTSSGLMKVGTTEIEVEVIAPPVTKARDVEPPQVTRASATAPGPDVTAPRRAVAAPAQPTVARTKPPPGPPAEGEHESERSLAKAGLIAVVLTSTVGLPGAFHPQPEPGDANPRAFLETIVPSDTWTPLHLAYLIGITVSLAFYMVLNRSLSRGEGAYWARLGYAFAIVAGAVGGIWMMLDGVAMKLIADDWDAATGAEKVAVEQSAFAIEHFILALFSFHIIIWAGVTTILFGLALLRDGRWQDGLGLAGIAVGSVAFILGTIQLFTERTALVTHALVPIMYITYAIWLLVIAVVWWRRAKALPAGALPAL